RKVMEIKRKIMTQKGDPDELQAVLTHAKRMEMAARKKKHHLELEEMIENTKVRDERQEQSEETFSDLKKALAQNGEEKVAKKEDAIFDTRREMLLNAEEDLGKTGEDTEESLSEMNEIIAQFGEEELKQLEEAMEAFESIEALDPHMSDAQFEDLKRKHRAAENKAIAKADMDYLKDMARIQSPSINLLL
ncbi:MAG: hypothetical protein J5842_01845, partial [Lachnospiraceae bacterium]|nr:hypothetical protein [Lachnospiraceae bacterium]